MKCLLLVCAWGALGLVACQSKGTTHQRPGALVESSDEPNHQSSDENPPGVEQTHLSVDRTSDVTLDPPPPHRASPEGAHLKLPQGGGSRQREIVLRPKPGTVRGPVAYVTVAVLKVTGALSDAMAVVARMRGGFRRCYQRGLDRSHPDAGVLRLTMRIDGDGRVTSVASETKSHVHSSVQTCVKARVRAAQFRPPQEGQAEVVAQVTFAKK